MPSNSNINSEAPDRVRGPQEDQPGPITNPASSRRALYATGELIEFHHVVDTILAWSDEILAWHDTGRPSNGRIEGTNNLLLGVSVELAGASSQEATVRSFARR